MASGAQQKEQSELKLEAILPDWCALSWQQTIVCSAFVFTFLWLSYLPVPTSTTWHDVWQAKAAGISSVSAIDTASIGVPLSAGMRHYEIPQIGYGFVSAINEYLGPEGLTFGFCILQTLCAALWAWLFFRACGRWWTLLIAPAAILLPMFDQGLTTSVFGGICLVAVLLILTSRPDSSEPARIRVGQLSWPAWIVLIATFAIWTNVDHSFVFGWLILLCLVAGRSIALIRSGSRIFSDSELRSRLILLECGILSSLLNPAGIELWKSLFWFPDQPILLAYGGWQPLVLSGMIGATVVATAAFWIYCSRFRKQIIPELWLIPAVAIGCLSMNPSLISFWMLPVVWTSLAMLKRPNVQPVSHREIATDEAQPLRFTFSLVCLLLLWLGFAFSPFAHHAIGGESRTDSQLLGKSNPTAALAFLAEKGQESDSTPLLLCPRNWSHQSLLTIGNCEVFATPQRHLIPDQANVDYDIIFHGRNGWRKLLDRYTVDVVLVDKSKQDRLVHNLRAKPGDWERIYEDSIAIIWAKGLKNE